jgi:hypothetical protein
MIINVAFPAATGRIVKRTLKSTGYANMQLATGNGSKANLSALPALSMFAFTTCLNSLLMQARQV